MSDTEDDQISDLRNADVVTKYKQAGEFANKVLAFAVGALCNGKKISEVCAAADAMIEELVGTVYKSKKLIKGVAFPTCVSVNHCVGHFSPLADDAATLKTGDIAKVDLGVHIDGFIAVCAQTVVVPETAGGAAPTVDGKAANAMAAAHAAAECALHTLRPGAKNGEVTDAITAAVEHYKCSGIEHITSNQMKQWIIDASKVIAITKSTRSRVDECTFEENEVYAIDVLVSTGEGKGRELDVKTSVYKRNVDQNYSLKMKASRYFFSEINTRFPTMPFTIRAMDEVRARLGLTECLQHNLLEPYPVIFEKAGEIVAQVKYTVLLMPSGSMVIAGNQACPANIKPDVDHSDQIKEYLARPIKKPKKSKAKKAVAAKEDK